MKRSSQCLVLASSVFSVLILGAGLAHADRTYPLNHPAVTWDTSSSRCYVNGQQGSKVSTSATQGMPGGVGCRVSSSRVILIDPDEAALDFYSLQNGYSCEYSDNSDVVCEVLDPPPEENSCQEALEPAPAEYKTQG
jgi:hypothetical protein